MQAKQSRTAWGWVLGAGCLLGGCVAHAQATGYGDADPPVAFTEPPTLVNVDSDVWVVQDASTTVYYVDDFYWSFGAGSWRRSRFYDRAWAPVEFAAVPPSIARRDHRVYVHYHGASGARTRPAPRETVANPGPHHDEHRGPDKDERKEERREERKDEHGERKEEHDDHKAAEREHKVGNGERKNDDHHDKHDDKK